MERRNFLTTATMGTLEHGISGAVKASGSPKKPADTREKILVSGNGRISEEVLKADINL